MSNKWDMRYGHLASVVAGWSKDPSTQVGAVIARPNKTIASVGYNGFPAKMEDRPEWYADRDEKLKRIIHAEHNALNHCEHDNITGSTIYVYPLRPCIRCARKIYERGITRVVTVTTKEKNDYMLQPEVWERYRLGEAELFLENMMIRHETIVILD